jgi:hypothetical protein
LIEYVLELLFYVAKADGQYRSAEKTVVLEFVRELVKDARLSDDLIDRIFQRMAVPSLASFKRALGIVHSQQLVDPARLLAVCRELVDTQDHRLPWRTRGARLHGGSAPGSARRLRGYVVVNAEIQRFAAILVDPSAGLSSVYVFIAQRRFRVTRVRPVRTVSPNPTLAECKAKCANSPGARNTTIELFKSPFFNLSNPLSGQAKHLSDFFQRLLTLSAEPETKTEYQRLPSRKRR